MNKVKKFLVDIYNSIYDASLNMKLFLRWRKDLRLQKKLGLPQIMSVRDTLNIILENSVSVCRYGDGEFKLMDGEAIFFQQKNALLSQRLKEVIQSNDSKVLICLPAFLDRRHSIFTFQKGCREERMRAVRARKYLDDILSRKREKWYEYFDLNRVYGNALITRCYVSESDSDAASFFILWKKIFADRDVLIIEGEKTRFGVGNDLLSGCNSVRRILCPSQNAYESYAQIMRTVIDLYKENELCLIALGPTATVLAYDLAQRGMQSLDIGHLDIEYEWMCRGDRTHKRIEGKFVSEAKDGDKVGEIEDRTYRDEILCHIMDEKESYS